MQNFKTDNCNPIHLLFITPLDFYQNPFSFNWIYLIYNVQKTFLHNQILKALLIKYHNEIYNLATDKHRDLLPIVHYQYLNHITHLCDVIYKSAKMSHNNENI